MKASFSDDILIKNVNINKLICTSHESYLSARINLDVSAY